MVCKECQELLSEYIDAGLELGEQVNLERHLADCEPCRAVRDDLLQGGIAAEKIGEAAWRRRIGAGQLRRRRRSIGFGIASIQADPAQKLVGQAERRVETVIDMVASERPAVQIRDVDLRGLGTAVDHR